MDRDRFESMLQQILEYARAAGAEAADVLAVEADSLQATSYKGKIEKINRSHTLDVGLRVFKGKRQALVSTQDMAADSLKKIAEQAVSMLGFVPEDVNCGLREGRPSSIPSLSDLDLCDETPVNLEQLILRAKASEDAASTSDGVAVAEEASASQSHVRYGVASSSGLISSGEQTGHYNSVTVLAHVGSERQIHYDYSYQTHLEDLEDPVTLGRRTALWAQKKLNARKIASKKVPIIFDPRMGSRMLSYYVDALNGKSVSVQGRSFLQGKMGSVVAGRGISIVDDPFLTRGRGSVVIDHEMVVPQKCQLVKQGVLQSWILDLRTARKMKMESTGHGFRSPKGIPSPSPTNLYLDRGQVSADDLIKSVKEGFYVFDMMGYGYNMTTGDLSEGAVGFWIENGELTYPIHEVTIAGNLLEMFQSMVVADDLKFRYGVNTPTLLVEGMTIAGM